MIREKSAKEEVHNYLCLRPMNLVPLIESFSLTLWLNKLVNEKILLGSRTRPLFGNILKEEKAKRMLKMPGL